jgi:ABC-type phosphate/phosphonate transport system permease subunit
VPDMSETLQGVIIGGLVAGVVAIVVQLLAARNQADAARAANLQQDRVWHRDQRLEAHHAFLNQINRLVHVIGAIDRAGAGTPNAEARLADCRFLAP